MRTLAFRLTPGTDLRMELKRLARAHGVYAGCILSCAGSLTEARLRMPGAKGEEELFRTFVEPMEIVSLTGTLGGDGLHVHLSLARRDGACVGGHLVDGCIVNTTAELVIGELTHVAFQREVDPATGYRELHVAPRSSNEERGAASGPVSSPVVRERKAMLAGMKPVLSDGAFVFCVTDQPDLAEKARPLTIGWFEEDEGTAMILRLTHAESLGFDTSLPMARIVLQVFSALDGVGLTAGVSTALADAGIPCNVVAAYHHDNLFVPAALAERAMAVLEEVQREAVDCA